MNPSTFEQYRSGDGLAIVRHYTLNENTMDDKIGCFASDVEVAGPYSMLADARAMAYGDPRYIGYLISNTLARGFPQYARKFNRAFLALPALPCSSRSARSSAQSIYPIRDRRVAAAPPDFPIATP